MRRGLVLSSYMVLAYGEPLLNETSMNYATAIRDMFSLTRTRVQRCYIELWPSARGVAHLCFLPHHKPCSCLLHSELGSIPPFSPSPHTLGRLLDPPGHLPRSHSSSHSSGFRRWTTRKAVFRLAAHHSLTRVTRSWTALRVAAHTPCILRFVHIIDKLYLGCTYIILIFSSPLIPKHEPKSHWAIAANVSV